MNTRRHTQDLIHAEYLLAQAFTSARSVDYLDGCPEMQALARAEQRWHQVKSLAA